MKIPQSGLKINNPAFPLLQAGIAYWGITSGAGNALGTTLVCADLDNHPTYVGNRIKVLANGAWGQDREITAHAVGGILSLDAAYTDATGAAQQIAANTPFVILSGGGGVSSALSSLYLPTMSLMESWQLEVIDPAIWTETDPATGAAWGVDAVWTPHLMLRTIPNANETARLRSNQRWIAGAGAFGDNTYMRALNLAFEMRLANVGNIDNTLSLLGALTAGGVADRTTNNIIGFGLVGDALQTFSDDAGVETVNTGFGETLTDVNLFHIRVSAGQVAFYLNKSLIATHLANIPDIPMFLNWFYDTEAGGAATIGLGQIAAWTEVKI